MVLHVMLYSMTDGTLRNVVLHDIRYSIAWLLRGRLVLHVMLYSMTRGTLHSVVLHDIWYSMCWLLHDGCYSISPSTPCQVVLHAMLYSMPGGTPCHVVLHYTIYKSAFTVTVTSLCANQLSNPDTPHMMITPLIRTRRNCTKISLERFHCTVALHITATPPVRPPRHYDTTPNQREELSPAN